MIRKLSFFSFLAAEAVVMVMPKPLLTNWMHPSVLLHCPQGVKVSSCDKNLFSIRSRA